MRLHRLLTVLVTCAVASGWQVWPVQGSAARPTCFGARATIVGTGGSDHIRGTWHRDVIVGLGGDDVIHGGGQGDVICGGAGNDKIYGDGGADRVAGEAGDDYLWGGDGPDRLAGGAGEDRVRGGDGQDSIDGGRGTDLCVSPGPPTATRCDNTYRVSVSSSGAEMSDAGPDGRIGHLGLSDDGRYVAFATVANDLVPGDTNDAGDVFVNDRRTGETTRVSIGNDGEQADGWSYEPSVSGDGRFIAFTSYARNLVAGPQRQPGQADVFVRDQLMGTTTDVCVSTDGTEADAGSMRPSISRDGRYVAFVSWATNLAAADTNLWGDVFVRDRLAGTTMLASINSDGTPANNYSWGASLSADGRFVAFTSDASNLVPGDTNNVADVFVRNIAAGTTTRVSVTSRGQQTNDGGRGPDYGTNISADGRYVVFWSRATNLVRGDTNGRADEFIRDRWRGTTSRVSVSSTEQQANGPIGGGTVSADGRYVLFHSTATNLVPHDTNGMSDFFVRDRETGTTTRASLSTQGSQPNGNSYEGTISAHGQFVAFTSDASNLIATDTNKYFDAFVRIMR